MQPGFRYKKSDFWSDFIFATISLLAFACGLILFDKPWWLLSILFVILIPMIWIDLKSFRLPNRGNLLLAVTGIFWGLYSGDISPAVMIVGGIIGYSFFWLVSWGYRSIRGVDGLGMGDAKFLGAAGVWVGPLGLIDLLLVASASGMIFALVVGSNRVALLSQIKLPFGPFLALGLWFALGVELTTGI